MKRTVTTYTCDCCEGAHETALYRARRKLRAAA